MADLMVARNNYLMTLEYIFSLICLFCIFSFLTFQRVWQTRLAACCNHETHTYKVLKGPDLVWIHTLSFLTYIYLTFSAVITSLNWLFTNIMSYNLQIYQHKHHSVKCLHHNYFSILGYLDTLVTEFTLFVYF